MPEPRRIANNQMLAADPATDEIRRFLVGPRGCEVIGVITTPDHRTMFVNVQHSGEATTAWGTPTPANPRAVSNWPDFDPDGRPGRPPWSSANATAASSAPDPRAGPQPRAAAATAHRRRRCGAAGTPSHRRRRSDPRSSDELDRTAQRPAGIGLGRVWARATSAT
jgi:hypothetical protein